MNGIHDMGGMHGFGPVETEENEPVFHERWESRVLGMRNIIPDLFSPHGSRFLLESIPPDLYLQSSYYERLRRNIEDGLLKKGLVTSEELEEKTRFYSENPEAEVPRREDPELAKRVVENIYTRRPLSEHDGSGVASRFRVGDSVRARNMNISGHTRLPRYVRSKHGVVARLYGMHDFGDHVPEPERGPQLIYSVRFEAHELWGDSAEANQSVYIDMWESYLEPA